MRPHKLILKAFGPFAKETVVDFDSMGNSIYLISGDTGAGKTTIFDGIIYALYGTASGGARSGLVTEAFHSDYAKEGSHREEMRVELEFSNAGRSFTVVRRMYWGKKGDAQKAIKESTLSENGNTITYAKGREDKDAVTQKITELLGLDADQFRRIIMLAQGEFQKFLTAKSDERGVILGKLYDNRQHQDFQLRLKATRELLKNQDNSLVEEAKAQINTFVIPTIDGEDERKNIAIDNPLMLITIKKIIKDMKSELSELSKQINEKESAKSEFTARKAQGEMQNKLLDDLENKREMLSELDEEKEQIESLRSIVTRAEAAERVIHAEITMHTAGNSLDELLNYIQQLGEERDKLTECVKKLKDRADEIQRVNKPIIKELQKQHGELRSSIHFYEDLDESIANLKEKNKAVQEATESFERAECTLSRNKARQKEIADQLSSLDTAGESAVMNAKHLFDDATDRQKELKEMQKSIMSLHTMESNVTDLCESYQKALKSELAAENTHLLLNEAFIEGQAGILAEKMRDKLQREREVTCPVCGSIHTIADVSSFAMLHHDIPTKDAVDNAFSVLEEARKASKQAEKDYRDKEQELTLKKRALLEKSKKMILVSEWETLLEGTVLANAITACDEQVNCAKAKYEQSEKDKKTKEKAAEDKKGIDAQVETAEDNYKDTLKEVNSAKTDAATAENSVKNWKKQLEGLPDSKEAANELLTSISENIDSLETQIRNAINEHNQCVTDLATNKGNLESANSEKQNRAEMKTLAVNAFNEQMSKNGFDDADEYHMALSPEGTLLNQDEITEWIKNKKAVIESFDRKLNDLHSAIKQLTNSTKDMERIDVQALEDRITEISEEITQKKDVERVLTGNVRTDSKVYTELSRIQKCRSKYRKAYDKLSPLVDTADGKYAFSRYVLSGFFHRIVEQANVHLETITDGEYCLVPKETGDGRANIGLELKVLNTITNMERDTATLSGGQLFEASLSLALGLSDVVQMESASRIQIDSMFIDEGFGSLDGGRLDKSIEVLQHLSAGQRQIGIISHVARLDECLPKKIHVIAGDRGSTVKIETDV